MTLKHILLAVTALAFVPTVFAIDLSKTQIQIRSEILTVTPLNATFDATKASIEKRIKPRTFYIFESAVPLPKQRINGEWKFLAEWINGGKNIHSSICCLLGNVDGWPFSFLPIVSNQVTGYWGFDKHGKLVDVAVYKGATGP